MSVRASLLIILPVALAVGACCRTHVPIPPEESLLVEGMLPALERKNPFDENYLLFSEGKYRFYEPFPRVFNLITFVNNGDTPGVGVMMEDRPVEECHTYAKHLKYANDLKQFKRDLDADDVVVWPIVTGTGVRGTIGLVRYWGLYFLFETRETIPPKQLRTICRGSYRLFGDKEKRLGPLFAIEDMDLPEEQSLPLIIDLLKNEDEELRDVVARRLMAIGLKSAAAEPLARCVFFDDSISDSSIIAYALESLGNEVTPALPILISALEHDKPHVRENALVCLKAIGPPARPVLSTLKRMLREQDASNARWGSLLRDVINKISRDNDLHRKPD